MTRDARRRIARATRAMLVGLVGGILLVPVAWSWLTGQQLLLVEGGSMAPALERGELVLIDTRGADAIGAGDAVTVRQPDGTLLTHRVLAVAPDGRLTTRGDANAVQDAAAVERSAVVGAVVARIPHPYAGAIAASQALPGRISLGAALLGLVLLPLGPPRGSAA
ncbi:MAG: signal peptidase I, partial [Protaetiibacter sp.]